MDIKDKMLFVVAFSVISNTVRSFEYVTVEFIVMEVIIL